MKNVYNIEGMTCGHCVMSVEKEFAKEGIVAKADLDSNSVSLELDLNEKTYSKLKNALEEEGYELGSKVE